EIALNKLAFEKLISKIEEIKDFKEEIKLKLNQEVNSLKNEWEFQFKTNEESELLFGKSLLEISNSITKHKRYDNPEIYKSLIKGIMDFYLIDYSNYSVNEKVNEFLDKTYDYRVELLDKDDEESVEERQKLNRWIITNLLEEINISSNNYTINLNDPQELSFPIILLDECSFPVIIWERNQSKFLTSYTNKNQENDKEQFLEKLTYEKKEEILIIDASTKKEFTKDENTKVMDLIMPFIKKYKSELILVVLASFVAQMLTVSIPLIIQRIVDSVISQGNIRALGVFGSSLIIIVILEGLISISRTIIFSRTANLIDIGVGMLVIDKLLTLPFSYFSKRNVGETTSRINEVENVRSFLTGSGLTVILDAIFIVIYIAIMVSYSLPLTLVTLSIIPLITLITILISPIIRRLLRQQAIENAKVQSHLVESLSAIETIKAEQYERNVIDNWRKNYRKEVSLGYKKDIVSVTAGNAAEFIEQLSGLIAIWFGAYLVINSKLTVGQLFAFRILSGYVTGPIVRLSSVWQNIQEALLSFYRLSDILKRKSESYEDHLLETVSNNIRSIRFKDVDFTYSDKNKLNLVLNSLSFDSTNHKLLSIVGESGSGKSSILKLISKLYEPSSGKIFVDGININRLSTYSLRKGIAHVTQDSILFDGSIEENMRIGDLPVSKETIKWALDIACCEQFISLLEYGINTSVGERGQLLSGGQRQRIAIARAILHKPSILLLDEATSALDVATEFNLFNNFKKELPNTSIISVSHKLSSVAKFSDHILVLDKGYLVEEGTHEDLINKNKFYANLLSSQIKN
ncbi:peptidase domain-containing ABC transporter, partial [Prochlorococcus sp. AH-716-N03]|nr:peptidase domain-containing ABC transporter [Prochlorococcus sp. AH-716-N03]